MIAVMTSVTYVLNNDLTHRFVLGLKINSSRHRSNVFVNVSSKFHNFEFHGYSTVQFSSIKS